MNREETITSKMMEYGDLVCRLIENGFDPRDLHTPDSECMRLSNEIDGLLGQKMNNQQIRLSELTGQLNEIMAAETHQTETANQERERLTARKAEVQREINALEKQLQEQHEAKQQVMLDRLECSNGGCPDD